MRVKLFSWVCLLGLPVVFGVFLVWQEWELRERLASPLPIAVPPAPAPLREPLVTGAVATVFGLTTQTALPPSAEPLTLQASFVGAGGGSKALLGDAENARFYQVGERLPGGSVLRRVEADQVVLWNNGREEWLKLQPSAPPVLRRVEPSNSPSPAVSTARFFRPLGGQSE
jgi:hypothetical protein